MSLDRSIRWSDFRPRRDTVEDELREYLGSAGEIDWKGNTLFAKLPGECTDQTLRGRFDGKPVPGYSFPPIRKERWFEVWFYQGEDELGRTITITTRQQDEFTNVVAAGFAARLARKFQGTSDDLD